MKKRLEFLLPIAVAVILGGCGTSQKEEPFHRCVMLTQPNVTGTAKEKSLSGVVKESHEINLGFKTAGQIEAIYVKEGDYVKEGQLVAALDSKDYQLGLNATQIQYDQLARQVERLKKLKEGKSISGNDYDKAVSGLEQLAIKLQADKNSVAYTKLYSPISGYVRKVNFDPAEMVNAGTPVMVLLDTKNMGVEVNIPAEIFANKKNIKEVYCFSSLSPETKLPMKVVGVAPKADGNQLYQMQLAFTSNASNKNISSGMNVGVMIVMKDGVSKEQITLPLHSIFNKDEQSYVWILNADSTVSKLPVTVKGLDNQGDAIIEGELKGDEKVVKAGVNLLQEGEKVRVIEQSSETNVGGVL